MSVPGRAAAFGLLALASLFWAGNWVIGRALREAIEPVALNFCRWMVAVVVLAPFAWPRVRPQLAVVRANLGILALLSLLGVALFQGLVYLGLRSTTAVNAVLLNSSAPLFMMLCAWFLDRERSTPRQAAGMLLSLAGILVIMARGEWAHLQRLELHAGDLLILLAMPVWGAYSVLLKRRPPELGGVAFLFVISVLGVAMLAPVAAWEALGAPPRELGPGAALGVLYVGLAASVGAFICWNRGVAVVGANAAGFTLHLLPAFGTVLAILVLGESFQGFHAAGIATILAGVVIATRAGPAR
jgi:drug/metabolite transporter (DMT)-like permease